MPESAISGTRVEVVRGRLTDERAEELVRLWTGHGMLDEEAARGRLREVVCLLLDESGEVVGANSSTPPTSS